MFNGTLEFKIQICLNQVYRVGWAADLFAADIPGLQIDVLPQPVPEHQLIARNSRVAKIEIRVRQNIRYCIFLQPPP